MNIAQVANLAKQAALKNGKKSLNGIPCSACSAPPMLGAFTDEFKLSGVLGAFTDEFKLSGLGGVVSTITDSAKPALPWILLTAVVVGLVGWKMGYFFCGAKRVVIGSKKRRRK